MGIGTKSINFIEELREIYGTGEDPS